MSSRVRHPQGEARAVLSEVLPFEVPPMFSNKGFYNFLADRNIRSDGARVTWPIGDETLDRLMKLMLGYLENDQIPPSGDSERHALPRKGYSIPFRFQIGRGDHSSRALAVAHPADQILVTGFYASYRSLMLHFTSHSPYSMRYPAAVTRYTVVKDRLHEVLRRSWGAGIETSSREDVIFQSYFNYERYGNIYKFYESEHIQQLEKRFQKLMRLDVARCFESIYTHSIAWSLYGKDYTKRNVHRKNKVESFGERFDSLMQKLNYNETNGIIVGPEISRIFAEIILQAVDRQVDIRLKANGLRRGVDFQIQRYVDDFFVFCDFEVHELLIARVIEEELFRFNLHLNASKRVYTQMPDVSPMSIAKVRISRLLTQAFVFYVAEEAGESPQRIGKMSFNGRNLITEYKTILKETGVRPSDISNYILSVIEKRVVSLLSQYARAEPETRGQDDLISGLLGTIDFIFYVYAGSPRVNPTVKLCRIINHLIEFTVSPILTTHERAILRDSVYREIFSHLEKNKLAENMQVENLYLLTAMSQLGRDYLLPERILFEYFSVEDGGKSLSFKVDLNYFSVVTLLAYMQNRTRYSRLRRSLEQHVLDRLDSLATNSAERFMLILDLVSCPFVSDRSKSKLLDQLGVRLVKDRVEMRSLTDRWFVQWNDFDLGVELDSKRNQEVY